MKSYLIALGILCTIHFATSQGFKGDTWAEAQRTKKAGLIITEVHSPGFSVVKDGQRTGMCYNMMNDFAEYVQNTYGIRVSYKYQTLANTTNFQLFLSAIQQSAGGVFGLGSVTITDQRKKTYEFTPPFFSNMSVLVTNGNVRELSSLRNISESFKGMKAVSQGGTTHDKLLNELKTKYGGFDIIYAASSIDKEILVEKSPNFFTYMDLPNFLELKAKGKNVMRHSVGDVSGDYYGIIMPKGSDWAPIITEFFEANGGYVNSEVYREALVENFDSEVVKLMDQLAN